MWPSKEWMFHTIFPPSEAEWFSEGHHIWHACSAFSKKDETNQFCYCLGKLRFETAGGQTSFSIERTEKGNKRSHVPRCFCIMVLPSGCCRGDLVTDGLVACLLRKRIAKIGIPILIFFLGANCLTNILCSQSGFLRRECFDPFQR